MISHTLTQWEYFILYIGFDEKENPLEEINKLGLQGWELVSVALITMAHHMGSTQLSTYYFKRMIKL